MHVYLDKYWLCTKSIPAALFVAISVLCPFYNFSLPFEGQSAFFWLLAILDIIILSIYLYGVIINSVVPKPKSNCIAILMNIQAENKKLYNDTISKLGEYFGESIKKTGADNFDIKYVPYNICEKVTKLMQTKPDQSNDVTSKGYIYYIEVKVKADDCENPDQYEMRIKNVVLRPKYEPMMEARFAEIFREIVKPISYRSYTKGEKLPNLHATATQLAGVCNFIVALSLSFTGVSTDSESDIKLALKIIDSFYDGIRDNSNVASTQIAAAIKPLGYGVHMVMANMLYSKYLEARKYNMDNFDDILTEVYKHANIALGFCEAKLDYYMLLAACSVLKNRDISNAQMCIQQCSRFTHNQIWRYSDAFLKAYNSSNPLTIYRKYQQAFSVPTNIPEIITFIEMISSEEPDRNGLKFALGLLYSELPDSELCEESFNSYISSVGTIDAKVSHIISEKLEHSKRLFNSMSA